MFHFEPLKFWAEFLKAFWIRKLFKYFSQTHRKYKFYVMTAYVLVHNYSSLCALLSGQSFTFGKGIDGERSIGHELWRELHQLSCCFDRILFGRGCPNPLALSQNESPKTTSSSLLNQLVVSTSIATIRTRAERVRSASRPAMAVTRMPQFAPDKFAYPRSNRLAGTNTNWLQSTKMQYVRP